MVAILAAILLAFAPSYLDRQTSEVHAAAAVAAEAETGVPATLLLAVAYVESRYQPMDLSRLQCDKGGCRRVTGPWHGSEAPPGARRSWFCGPLQSGGDVPWEECQRMRTDIAYGYLAGAREIDGWSRDPKCRRLGDDRMLCALRGYNGGYAAISRQSNAYAPGVLRLAAALRRRLVAALDA